jgi:Nuclease-related domain
MLRRKARAGVYAERRYRRGVRTWRARTRPLFISAFGPFIVAGVVVYFMDGHRLVWLAGMVTGLLLGAWIALRDSPPRYVENWHDGAEGEKKTERALGPLEREGWRTFHDVQARYGNYDHIAVGPAGVFLLESKNLMGTVELRDGVPHLQRRLDPEAEVSFRRIRPQALAAAAGLKEEIERRSGQRTWVQAVVVFWSEFPQGVVDDGRCVFLHGSKLLDWIKGKPARLNESGVGMIAGSLAEIAGGETVAGAPTAPSGLARA